MRKSFFSVRKPLIAALSVAVVGVTVGSLTHPAITMNGYVCGLEEHTHITSCYSQETTVLACGAKAHEHIEECYTPEGNITCNKAEYLLHTHIDACFDAEGAVICPLPEIFEHSHTEECSDAEGNSICEVAENIAHEHGEGCFNENSDLICTVTELLAHEHSEECFTVIPSEKVCAFEEHTHDSNCEEAGPLSEEEQLAVDDVIFLIDTLPSIEEIEQNFTEVTGDELEAYKQKITSHIKAAFDGYNALTAKQKELVTNYEKLVPYAYLIEEDEAVKEVLGRINAIPTAAEFKAAYEALAEEEKAGYIETYQTETAAIRELYNALTDEQKALVTNESKLTALEELLVNLTKTEDTLKFEGEGYTTEITYPIEANLPEDTVITVNKLEEGALNVNDKVPAGSADLIKEAIPWATVQGFQLFDITLTSGETEVQPEKAVEITLVPEEPLTLGEGQSIYGVHFIEHEVVTDFGVETEIEVEIIPATYLLNEEGKVVSVTYEQSSFSVSGLVFTFVHQNNPSDIGVDVLPVHYAVYVNSGWMVVGSTRTGWYGDYSVTTWTDPTKRDCVTLEQVLSVLRPYIDPTNSKTEEQIITELDTCLFYQRAEAENTRIYNDTEVITKTVNGVETKVFPLSRNDKKDNGYHIFYVPNFDKGDDVSYTNSKSFAEQVASTDSKYQFYTVTVRDMNHEVYAVDEEDLIPDMQIIPAGAPVEVVVRRNLNPTYGGEPGWQWVNNVGKVVNADNPRDERFVQAYDTPAEGLVTYGIKSLQGRATLIPQSNAVEGATQKTTNTVDVVICLDNEWTRVGTISLMYKKEGVCDGRWFITDGQIYSLLKNYGFSSDYNPDDEAGTGHKFVHIDEAFDPNNPSTQTFHVDAINQEIGSTVAMGFHTEDKNYTVYYVPASSNEDPNVVAAQTPSSYIANEDLIKGDRFYSIKVIDDNQLIYYAEELEYITMAVQEGGSIEVRLQNGLNAQWSVRSENFSHVKPTNKNGMAVFNFENVTEHIEIVATAINPYFTVQYYAPIDRYILSDSATETANTKKLQVIDTSGGILPKNVADANQNYVYITLNRDTSRTVSKSGVKSYVYTVAHQEKNTKLYEDTQFEFARAYLWRNIDKLYTNKNYTINEVWILKEGMNPSSETRSDWWIYKAANNGTNISFTNNAYDEDAPRIAADDVQKDLDGDGFKILITENMIVRLNYVMANSSLVTDAIFHDYDISNGYVSGSTSIYGTNKRGINSSGNYLGGTSKYAFGNDNHGTGLSRVTWTDPSGVSNLLNMFNTNKSKGCTFGLVTGYNTETNQVIWANGVNGIDIFGTNNKKANGSTEITGKRTYTDGKLTFSSRGDVYTLTMASSADAGNISLSGLHEFFNPSYTYEATRDGGAATLHSGIFTNNFWVLDNAPNSKDPKTGNLKYNTRPRYSSSNNTSNTGRFAASDDSTAHNFFFGMNFKVNFDLTADYIGPIEYIFFGDDDMWVFLEHPDGKQELICDIGGVHSAVGEYVNLRDYLPNGSSGRYSLTFFYTERGASGSTCWMSFTLPSVTSVNLEEDTANIEILKTVVDTEDRPLETNEQFEFTFRLYKDNTRSEEITRIYNGHIVDENGTIVGAPTVSSGSKFYLRGNEKLIINDLPIGSYYVITETEHNLYTPTINEKSGWVYEGTVTETHNSGNFVNHQNGYRLPNTGGTGTTMYIFGGVALMGTAALIYIRRKPKRKAVEN